jgi:hypothetical protein
MKNKAAQAAFSLLLLHPRLSEELHQDEAGAYVKCKGLYQLLTDSFGWAFAYRSLAARHGTSNGRHRPTPAVRPLQLRAAKLTFKTQRDPREVWARASRP